MAYITFVKGDERGRPSFSVEGVEISNGIMDISDVIDHCVGSYGEGGASYIIRGEFWADVLPQVSC